MPCGHGRSRRCAGGVPGAASLDSVPSGPALGNAAVHGARSGRVGDAGVAVLHIFGLLQTESCTRAQFMASMPVEETTTPFVEENVRLRMQRKELLTRDDNPLTLRVILDESVLRRVVGGPEVTREQHEETERLTTLAHITVPILPQDTATCRAEVNFVLLDFDAPVDPIVQSDTPGSIMVTGRPTDVWKYNRRFDAMRAEAPGSSATAAFLHRPAREIEATYSAPPTPSVPKPGMATTSRGVWPRSPMPWAPGAR
ncbi:DUF5753 domain-containing protein [Streptomyces sp. NPDC051956]|uniref:DUF5753 domain-containing protein n=1 Tax=Streptomyces sp. NPDC051956 TaxID=3365677 RepID=UPI0037CDC075